MGDIVEHVGRAIADADMEDYMEFYHLHDARARAAIRATLEFLRENVSDNMVATFDRHCDEHGQCLVKTGFRAMLSAALNDIEGGAG